MWTAMPVTVVPSSQQAAKKKSTPRKCRQNLNKVIHELASLVPLSSSQAGSLVPSNRGKPQTISVLRLTTTFLKLQGFMKDAFPPNDSSGEHVSLGRMEEAMDGFLIVLDKEANILYVSEAIAGHVGLIQQDVIGQNLADFTHPEFSTMIAKSLKPSLMLPTSVEVDFVVSQYRRFFLRLKPTVSYSTLPSHTKVQVCGSLKVQLSPSKTTSSGEMEFIEPSVIGFIGECRVVESVASILEISIPYSTYTVTRTLDLKKIISVEATVKDIIGYDPKDLVADGVAFADFIHPADQVMMKCRPLLVTRKGHAVSPLFRFLTRSGEWVWQQVEAKLHYKSGTSIPHFWEGKIKTLGQWGGNPKYIEQRELYQSTKDQGSYKVIPKLTSTSSKYHIEEGAKPIIDSLKNTRMPEPVLEPVLHRRPVAIDDFPELVKQMLENKNQHDRAKACRKQRKDDVQCSSVSTSDSELSPTNTAQCSPISHSGAQVSSTINQSGADLPIVPSAMQLNTPVIDSGTHVPPTVCAAEPTSVQSHLSPQLHVQQESTIPVSSLPNQMEQNGVPVCPLMSGSSTDSSPASSTVMVSPHQQDFIPSPEQFLNFTNPVEMCSPYNSATCTDLSPPSSYPVDMDTVLHTSSSTASIPSATSVPFQNPNSIPQAPLNDFNPQIPANFDFSNNTTSPYQPCNAHTSLFNSVSVGPSVSMPITQAFDSSNLLTNSSDLLIHQLVAVGQIMDESSVDIMACLPDATTSVDSMFSHSCPQNNFISDSNCSAHLQDATLSTPAHLNADLTSHMLVDSQASNLYSSSSNPEVQDILQQFM